MPRVITSSDEENGMQSLKLNVSILKNVKKPSPLKRSSALMKKSNAGSPNKGGTVIPGRVPLYPLPKLVP